MKKKNIIVICLISISFLTLTNPVKSQSGEGLSISNSTWQGEVAPGNNVNYRVEMVNLNNQTIKGILGNLSVTSPFFNTVNGESIILATGNSISTYFNVSQYTVLSGEPFQLVFPIEISSEANKGNFIASLNVSYLLNDLTTHFELFTLDLIIPNHVPIIDWVRPSQNFLNVNPSDVITFETLGFDPDNDTLTYTWKVNDQIVSTDRTFTYVVGDNYPAVHRVDLEISDGVDHTDEQWIINVNAELETTYTINTQYLETGSMNELEFEIENNIWNGTVDIDFIIQPPLVSSGDSSFTYKNVTSTKKLFYNVSIFTPKNVLGQTTIGTLSLQYYDKYSEFHTENIQIGLIAKGKINVFLFDTSISHIAISQGEIITFTGTLLNTGNIPAQFANASLSGPYTVRTEKSLSYLGEIEVDNPIPFSLTVMINQSAPLGTSTITCFVYYQNDLYELLSQTITFSIKITEYVDTVPNGGPSSDIFKDLFGSLFTFSMIIVIIGVVGYTILRYLRTNNKDKMQ